MSLKFNHIKGNTFDEVIFQLKINNVAVNLTGAVIKMQLRKSFTDTVPSLSLTTVSSAGLTITNATTGEFKINTQIIDIEVYNYLYDIQIILSSGVVKTYVQGSFNITNEVTR